MPQHLQARPQGISWHDCIGDGLTSREVSSLSGSAKALIDSARVPVHSHLEEGNTLGSEMTLHLVKRFILFWCQTIHYSCKCHTSKLLMEPFNCLECAAFQSVSVQRSIGNNVSGHYKHHYFCQTPVLGLGLGVDFTFPLCNKTTSTWQHNHINLAT